MYLQSIKAAWKRRFFCIFFSVFVPRNVKTSLQLDIFLSRLWLGSQLRQIQWTPTYLFKITRLLFDSLSLSVLCVFRFICCVPFCYCFCYCHASFFLVSLTLFTLILPDLVCRVQKFSTRNTHWSCDICVLARHTPKTDKTTREREMERRKKTAYVNK